MTDIVEGLNGVKVVMDDILIIGSGDNDSEASVDHDKNLIALMERLKTVNLKLNPEKFRFKERSVKYIGHVLTSNGLQTDPEKVRAIKEMAAPTNAKEMKTFLGMVNYLSKFLPQLSTLTNPLR